MNGGIVMDTAAIWVGYAVMIVGAFVVCLGALIGAAMVSNKMSHMVLNAYGGSFYMNSNTALFEDLCGWLPDPDAPPNVEVSGRPHHETNKER